ncbi:MAG: tRNA uracil 4-sulfurtransferase ThiI [Bacilli bacterium]
MEKLIMIKYGELNTKKGNIGYFLNTLKKNIAIALENYDVNIKFDKGRMFIFVNDNRFQEVLNEVKNVFGIHEITISYKFLERDIESIKENVVKLLKDKDFNTFKVVTKRSDKKYELTSMEVSKIVGGEVLKNIDNIKVDVNNPNLEVNIEIRTDAIYIYFETIKGIGGYPVGAQGKGLLMLSGGIDSPVAGYLAIKRGLKLECIYFESPPHTSEEAKNKVMALAKKLAIYNNDIKVHVVNFTRIQEEIYKNIPHEYLITIMRRMMYRISAIICKRVNGHVLVNGESIGQVASQTLTSMSVINEVVKIPVIRPVACFDKIEIIDVAKKIDTYETSILPYEDCCTIFVPDHPIINPDHSKCEEYEKLIPYEDLIYEAIKNHEVIKVCKKEKKEFKDLL